MSWWTPCGPWWCKMHHNILKKFYYIGLIWKTMQRSMWRLDWLTSKIGHLTINKQDCCDHYRFPKGHDSVSMDFMVSLPPSRSFDAIMVVVVDRFSKMAHFIPTKDSAMAQETRRLFFSHMFKHHGLPKDIMLNQDQSSQASYGERCGNAWGRSSRWAPHSDPERMNKPKRWTWLSNNS